MNQTILKPELKDVIDIDKLINEGYKKIAIYAGVGAGKSSWVKNVLANKGCVLFITSRKATVKQDLKNSSFKKYYDANTIGNQTLVTNAGLEKLIENISINGIEDLDEFLNSYDYIVIDEVHSLATDSVFAQSSMAVLSFMEYAIKKEKIVISMTGTPEPIDYYLRENNWLILDYINVCRYVHPKEVYFTKKRNIANKVVESVKSDRKVICFMNHVADIENLYKELINTPDIDVNEIAIIVAESRKAELYKSLKSKCRNEVELLIKAELTDEDRMKDELKEIFKDIQEKHEVVYESITEKNMIPKECKIVLSTSTLREGINIFNKDMTIFCDNHVLSNLIQFFGRVRVDGAKVYMIEDGLGHDVEKDDWLYNYASYEAEIANRYINEQKKNSDYQLIEELYILKKHLKHCNKYVYFDCIEKTFKIAHMLYKEQARLLENSNWLWRLRYYCSIYDIYCSPITNKEGCENFLPYLLKDAGGRKLKFFAEGQGALINIINDVCGSDYKQPSKLSEVLQKKGYPYEIITKTESREPRRNERYWMIVPLENAKIPQYSL